MSSIHIDKVSGDLKFYHDDRNISIIARNKDNFKPLTLPLVLDSQYQSVWSKQEPLVVFPASQGHKNGGVYQILIPPHTATKLKISPELNARLDSFSNTDYYLLNIEYEFGLFKTYGLKLSLKPKLDLTLLKCRSAGNNLSLIFNQDVYINSIKELLLTNTSSKIKKILTNDGSSKIDFELSEYLNYNTEIIIPENAIYSLSGKPLPGQTKATTIDYQLSEILNRWTFDEFNQSNIIDSISKNNLKQSNKIWQPEVFQGKYFDVPTGKFTQHQYLATQPKADNFKDFSFIWVGVINNFTQPYCNLFSANGLEKNSSGWRLYLDGQNKSLNFCVGPSIISVSNFDQLNQPLCIIGRHSEKYRDIWINGKQSGFQQNLKNPIPIQTFSVDHLCGEVLEIQVSSRMLEDSELPKIQEYFLDKL